MPVEGGAGRMRMETGRRECRPMPLASTGRCEWFQIASGLLEVYGCQMGSCVDGFQTEGSILTRKNPIR